jgi:hypothetical protein
MTTSIITPTDSPDKVDFLRQMEATDNLRAMLAEAVSLLYAQFETVLCAARDVDELDEDFNLIADMFGFQQCPDRADKDALRKAYKTARAKIYRSMPYPEYLTTEHWQTMREKALERADHRCQVCNTSLGSLHVHHRTYERRGRESLRDLIVLCNDCHRTFHEHGKLAS